MNVLWAYIINVAMSVTEAAKSNKMLKVFYWLSLTEVCNQQWS